MKAVAFALALAVMPAGAQAASDADELESVGYLGKWAADCSSPVSDSNWYYVTSRTPNNSVSYITFNGEAKPKSALKIEFVRRLPNGQIEIRSLSDQRTGHLIIQIEPDRVRTLSSVIDGVGEMVRDGILLRTGRPTPWVYRCDPKKTS